MTPPNTLPRVSSCTSNAPPPPQSFVWIWIPLLPPLGRLTEPAVCRYLPLIPFTERYHITYHTDMLSKLRLWFPTDYERGRWKKKNPFIGIPWPASPAPPQHNPEFTGGNYLQWGIPKFPISVFPPLQEGRIPDFCIYCSQRRRGWKNWSKCLSRAQWLKLRKILIGAVVSAANNNTSSKELLLTPGLVIWGWN